MRHWGRVESMQEKALLEEDSARQGSRQGSRLMFLSTEVVYVRAHIFCR